MKISKKRLLEIVTEECSDFQDQVSIGMEHDSEGLPQEARGKLAALATDAQELSEMLPESTQLEGWVEEKLSKVTEYIKTIRQYVELGMESGAYDSVEPIADAPISTMGPEMDTSPDLSAGDEVFDLDLGNFEEEDELY
jgi:hypothetical protein|tara:strand:+ start:2587 stop:3003 length:417 start_codon:yes stop_codon:yes gene_type:complete